MGSAVLGQTLVVCLLAFVGCSPEEKSSGSLLSGAGEQQNACTLTDLTVPLLDPAARFNRAKGKPVTETVEFSVPRDGELCVVVSNGLHDPPHGQRVSAAWISIDGELVIGPDPFDQNTAEIKAPHSVTAGAHELSVKLASKPGSFLTVQLMLLAEDEDPPVIVIVEPEHEAQIDTDLPLVRIEYSDVISGVDLGTLSVSLNGADVSSNFAANQEEAAWQITIGSFLEEGENEIEVTLSDKRGNEGSASSTFSVHTPTDVLLQDLDNPEMPYRRRSSYKLIYRTDEFAFPTLRKCLKQLNETPMPQSVDRLSQIHRSKDIEHISRALSANAVGEVFKMDGQSRQRTDLIDDLVDSALDQDSHVVKIMSVRALGFSKNEYAMVRIEEWFEDFLILFPEPPAMCEDFPESPECLFYFGYVWVTTLQLLRSIIVIAGQDYIIGNPGNILEMREMYIEYIKRAFAGW